MKSELKTRENDASVAAFLEREPDAARRAECAALLAMMQRISGAPPRMWGKSMVGFGQYHYVYATGREGDWFVIGFSPRKQNLAIYLMCGFEVLAADLEKLGKHKLGKCCLYLKQLGDIDLKVLERLLRSCVKHMKKHQACGDLNGC